MQQLAMVVLGLGAGNGCTWHAYASVCTATSVTAFEGGINQAKSEKITLLQTNPVLPSLLPPVADTKVFQNISATQQNIPSWVLSVLQIAASSLIAKQRKATSPTTGPGGAGSGGFCGEAGRSHDPFLTKLSTDR